jgi:hypothetical protein
MILAPNARKGGGPMKQIGRPIEHRVFKIELAIDLGNRSKPLLFLPYASFHWPVSTLDLQQSLCSSRLFYEALLPVVCQRSRKFLVPQEVLVCQPVSQRCELDRRLGT